MSDISSTGPVLHANSISEQKLEKGIKIALNLKITALVLAVLSTVFTLTASALVFPAGVVIGVSVITCVLIIGSLAALIAQEVLMKTKRKTDEKAIQEKNQQQNQKILELSVKSRNFEKINSEIKIFNKNQLPKLMDLFKELDNFSKPKVKAQNIPINLVEHT